MTTAVTPVLMDADGAATPVTDPMPGDAVDRTEMFDLIRGMPADELAIFTVPDAETGEKTMFAIRNLHKRVKGKRFRSFFEFPKIYVIRYA